MKKVRVIKEMPFVKVGQCFDVTNTNFLASSDYNAEYLPVLYEGKHVDCFIAAGWLEEVKEPQNIVRVVKDAYKYQTDFGVVELGDELARKISTAAMKYASEVASKAVVAKYQALHPQAVLIIETLIKESEGI